MYFMEINLSYIAYVLLLGLALFVWWLISQLRMIKAQLLQLISETSGQSQLQLSMQLTDMQSQLLERNNGFQASQEKRINELSHTLLDKFNKRQLEALQLQQENLSQGMSEVRKQVTETLVQNGNDLGKKLDNLTRSTDEKLKEISVQVDKRLNEGFEKTTATFADVVKRLVLIDEAQKKITELSSNVVSLQEVLADKRSRGAFGEVQLNALVRNVMPENSFSFQHTLSNNTVAILRLTQNFR